jgi:hypothetical protein
MRGHLWKASAEVGRLNRVKPKPDLTKLLAAALPSNLCSLRWNKLHLQIPPFWSLEKRAQEKS